MYTFVFLGILLSLEYNVCETQIDIKLPTMGSDLAAKVLSKSNESMVVSTLSLKFLFCKIAAFSNGETKRELISALRVPEYKLNTFFNDLRRQIRMLKEMDLILFNKIYINYTGYLNPSFMTNSTEDYGVTVNKLSFNFKRAAMAFINSWVDSYSYRRIQAIVNENDLDDSTSIFMISAAHMKGTWEKPFDIRNTILSPFRCANNTRVPVPTMTKYETALYYRDFKNGYQMVSIHLFHMDCSMLFILPETVKNLNDFLSELSRDPEIVIRNKKNMKHELLKIVLPKFRIKTHLDWTEHLEKIGVKKVFDRNTTGLEAISTNNKKTSHHVDKVVQKIFFECDETGPQRQLIDRQRMNPENYTELDYDNMGAVPFILNRPFYFSIELINQYDLFNGVYFGPQ